MTITNEIIDKIVYEVNEWEIEEFTNASYTEIYDDVVYNMEKYGEDIETALQHTNDKIMDGNL